MNLFVALQNVRQERKKEIRRVCEAGMTDLFRIFSCVALENCVLNEMFRSTLIVSNKIHDKINGLIDAYFASCEYGSNRNLATAHNDDDDGGGSGGDHNSSSRSDNNNNNNTNHYSIVRIAGNKAED